MNPSVTLTNPWVDPPNTFRADNTTQMYTAVISGSVQYSYDVGLPPIIIPTSLLVSNKSTSNDLQVNLELPEYINSLNPVSFIVTAQQSASINLLFNENVAKELSKTRQRIFIEPIRVFVTPLLVNGPVFVETDAVASFPSLV